MAKDPAILFYTSDFLSGTTLMSNEQVGQYIRLLCHQHQNGHLPESHMIYICSTLVSPVVDKFVKDDEGKYYNKRLEEEIKKRATFCESRRSNINKRYSKSTSVPTYVSTSVLHMENRNENRNINDNDNEKPDIIYPKYSPEYQLSSKLLQSIQSNNTAMKKPNMQKWSGTFNKIHRIDDIPWDKISRIMHKARADSFWSTVLLSPESLRKNINNGKLDKFIPAEYDTDETIIEKLKEKERLESNNG